MRKVLCLVICLIILSLDSIVVADDNDKCKKCPDWNDFHYRVCMRNYYDKVADVTTDISKTNYCKAYAELQVMLCVSSACEVERISKLEALYC